MTLDPKPPQNQGEKILPRLLSKRRGIKIASEDGLEVRAEIYDALEMFFSGVVIAGVLFEVFIAYSHPWAESPQGRWGPVIADAFVGVGLLLEMIFSSFLKTVENEQADRTKLKLAEALTRAARAEEQIAARSLSEEQFNELMALRDVVQRVSIVSAADFESTRFAVQIEQALDLVGVRAFRGIPRAGLFWSGIYIALPETPSDLRTDPLVAAFIKTGLQVGAGARDNLPLDDLPPDMPVIMVGEKGISYAKIPYVFGFVTPGFKPPKAEGA